MIVIVIMGVVYTLSVTALERQGDRAKRVTLLTLKSYLTDLKYERDARLLCLDDCSECDVLVDGEKETSLENFLDDTVRLYHYSYVNGAQEVLKEVYFNKEDVQEDVCFSYKVDKEGVGDQVLVEYKEHFYDFTNYLEPTVKYDSMQELVDAKESKIEEVLR